MSIMEAVNAIRGWLHSTGVKLAQDTNVRPLSGGLHVSIEQLSPVATTRSFAIMPMDVADCWQVSEVAA